MMVAWIKVVMVGIGFWILLKGKADQVSCGTCEKEDNQGYLHWF